VMLPTMLGGMLAGMVIGMYAAMAPLAPAPAAMSGAGLGLAALAGTCFMDRRIKRAAGAGHDA